MNTREGIRNSIAATDFSPRASSSSAAKSKDDGTKVGGPPDGAPLPRRHRHVDEKVSVTLSLGSLLGFLAEGWLVRNSKMTTCRCYKMTWMTKSECEVECALSI